jgi:hypothetical protein
MYLPGLLAAGKNTAAASTPCLPIKQIIISKIVALSKDDTMVTTLVLGQFFGVDIVGGELLPV